MKISYERKHYPGLINVQFKTVEREFEPGRPKQYFAKGPNDTDWFEYRQDAWGNICNLDGIVVYPSQSGKHPLQTGERGYFGQFRENYAPGVHPELPSAEAMTIRTARQAAGLTQKQLAEAADINIRQIQKVESGEAAAGNLTARNLLALADALGVDPHELI